MKSPDGCQEMSTMRLVLSNADGRFRKRAGLPSGPASMKTSSLPVSLVARMSSFLLTSIEVGFLPTGKPNLAFGAARLLISTTKSFSPAGKSFERSLYSPTPSSGLTRLSSTNARVPVGDTASVLEYPSAELDTSALPRPLLPLSIGNLIVVSWSFDVLSLNSFPSTNAEAAKSASDTTTRPRALKEMGDWAIAGTLPNAAKPANSATFFIERI